MLELSNLIYYLGFPVAIAEPNGRILYHNPQFASYCSLPETSLNGQSLRRIWAAPESAALAEFLENPNDFSPDATSEGFVGQRLSATPIYFAGHRAILCQATSRNADEPAQHIGAEMKRSVAKLAQLDNKIQLAIDASGIGIWEFDPNRSRVHWDDRILAIYGLPPGENERDSSCWAQFLHPDDADEILAHTERCTLTKSDLNLDFRIIRADGQVRHIRTLARFETLSPSETRLIGVNIDVTDEVMRTLELERARTKLEYDSRHDALTGLANRRLLDEIVADILKRNDQSDVCTLHMDLDHFKDINDRLGHPAGDAVLKHVAHTLRRVLRDADLICRLGGDEFVALFASAPTLDKVSALANQVIGAFKAPYIFEGHTCTFSISIGSATGQDPIKTLAHSDIALYAAKNAGRSCYHVYSERTGTRVDYRLKRRQDLIDALSEDRIECWYQPQFDARTREIVGAEALARLRTETGTYAPEDFLPLAEETGLLSKIEAFIFQCALDDQSAWAQSALVYPRVSINLSKHQLADPRLAERASQSLKPHHTISLELLESAFLDEPDTPEQRTIEKLRQLGVFIELDDFGSGHASLVAMMQIKPHRIKIDQRLVRNIATRPSDLAMLQALTGIARAQGIGAVLEGIETPEQLQAVRHVDCDVLQGFALSPPITADAFANLLEDARQQATNALSRQRSAQPTNNLLGNGSDDKKSGNPA